MNRAYYSECIPNFINQEPSFILGELADKHPFDLTEKQRSAWRDQIILLKNELADCKEGHIFFEYSIPRIGKRVDCILFIHSIVFVIEFKVGSSAYERHAIEQVIDYALDLKNFHDKSHSLPIVPILIASEARTSLIDLTAYDDDIYHCQNIKANDLFHCISTALQVIPAATQPIDALTWAQSSYRPTPTIIEAAQALYKNHSVEEIARSDSEAINLSVTSNAILEIIKHSYENQQKSICFITGVPGAGKTLAGLNIANHNLHNANWGHAVFLSGNGPLVKVLTEALARDKVERSKEISKTAVQASRLSKKQASSQVNAFIQLIHHFRDDYLQDTSTPNEHVVIFDEAQRAWTQEQTSKFMREKKGQSNFEQSEPEFLISVLDRHQDWAVIIALIGGGQEINTGEAGLPEWFQALHKSFRDWHVYSANNLTGSEYTQGNDIFSLIDADKLHLNPALHLNVSIRSFRAEHQSTLIKAVLDNQIEQAQLLYQQLKEKYPIRITRDIQKAKNWLKQQARGSERYGILASSGADRLKPHGIHVKIKNDIVNWLLEDKSDIRSSFFLEDVVSEFDIQGLEIDWACVGWDADLRYVQGSWHYHKFRGNVWQKTNNEDKQRFTKNAYRVLLTRARQGLVIFVPEGDENDHTRPAHYYDGTYALLHSIGFEEL